MSYDNINYWSTRINPNSADIDIDTPVHLGFLKKHLEGAESVLDCGPGIGRLLPAYVNLKKVEAFDIVNTYESRLMAYADSLGVDLKFTLNKTLGLLPYDNNYFDVAVATEVLLHLKPKDVLVRMDELIRVANKVIVISWMEDGGVSKGHCFNHNYLDICESKGYIIESLEKYKRQVMFVYRRS